MHLPVRWNSSALLLAATVWGAGLVSPAMGLVAFPGADGFGADALGGRGGAVYHVTNLTDDTSNPAAGSFRGVLAQVSNDEKKGTVSAATIVFDVGGTIPLTSNLDVKGISNVTIAGQTAPGPGITMVGYKFDVTSSSGTKQNDITSNIVIRYLADRRGNTISSADDDAMGVLGSTSDQNHNTHDIIMDHVTAAWGMDEDLSVTDSATNVTISNSFITEALESGHQFGSLIRPRYGASVSCIGNLYANNRSRNPRPGSYNNSLLNFDFRDNTVYNWGDRAGYTGGASDNNTEYVNMNYTGNYLIAGPSTPTSAVNQTAYIVDTSNGTKDPLDIQVYQANNLMDVNRNGVADGADIGWTAFVQYNGTTVSPFGSNQSSILTTVPESSPFAYNVPGTATTDPTIAYEQTLADAGTTPWNRNESDARIVQEVQSNGGAILLTAPSGEYSDLINQQAVYRPANFDTDGDGMPDSWETARGLNPGLASDGNLVVTSSESPGMAGYTWLEMYLNDLTLQANWAGGATGTWDTILNWQGQLPNLQDSTANFGNIGAAGQISIGSDEHVGQLTFDNPAGYTLSGSGDISMDVLSHAGGGYATVTVLSGDQRIAVPLNIRSNTRFTISTGSMLDVTGPLNASGMVLNKDGGGNAEFNNIIAGGLAITNGKVIIRPGATADGDAGASAVGMLAIGNGASLDLTNNKLVINFAGGADPVGSIAGYLQSGCDGGAWDGYGITSSSIAGAPGTALGYADGNTDSGTAAATGTILIEFTWLGDLNLDGIVDNSDLERMYQNLGQSNADWADGDLNYDGVVNADDFALFAVGASESKLAARVPEPAGSVCIAFCLLSAGGYSSRRSARSTLRLSEGIQSASETFIKQRQRGGCHGNRTVQNAIVLNKFRGN